MRDRRTERRFLGFALLTFEFHREGRLWVAVCRELGVAADGRDVLKLGEHLADLVALHLNGLEEAGELERVFRERGLVVYTDEAPVTPVLPLDEALSTPLIQYKKVNIERAELAATHA